MLQAIEKIRLFRHRAELVSAVVRAVSDLDEAFAYVVDVCHRKEACTLLPSGCELELSDKANALCRQKPTKLIAAPDLDPKQSRQLKTHCDKLGIQIVSQGLRNHLGGIDIGLTWAQFGIAETGTLVIDSTDEDTRLATMISEIHVALLPAACIVGSALDIEKPLRQHMNHNANYMAMITGASRTADIERVLALGVHGPLELHIVLIEGNHAQTQ